MRHEKASSVSICSALLRFVQIPFPNDLSGVISVDRLQLCSSIAANSSRRCCIDDVIGVLLRAWCCLFHCHFGIEIVGHGKSGVGLLLLAYCTCILDVWLHMNFDHEGWTTPFKLVVTCLLTAVMTSVILDRFVL